MSFPQPEPYVLSATVRAYFGGITHKTLMRWIADGMPVHQRGRRSHYYFKLSECDAWFNDIESACTATPAGSDAA